MLLQLGFTASAAAHCLQSELPGSADGYVGGLYSLTITQMGWRHKRKHKVIAIVLGDRSKGNEKFVLLLLGTKFV